MKEWLLPENHGSQHAAKTPHVKAVVIHLVIHQEFWPFEVSAGNAHIVLLARVVELSQPPVNQPEPPVLMVYHHIVRLHVPMHDAHAVAVVQSPQQLIEVASYIIVSQGLRTKVKIYWAILIFNLVELLEVSIVHMLENECWSSANWVLKWDI